MQNFVHEIFNEILQSFIDTQIIVRMIHQIVSSFNFRVVDSMQNILIILRMELKSYSYGKV